MLIVVGLNEVVGGGAGVAGPLEPIPGLEIGIAGQSRLSLTAAPSQKIGQETVIAVTRCS